MPASGDASMMEKIQRAKFNVESRDRLSQA
jgi:hypothetical protein